MMNLKSKLQLHQVFEAELTSNQDRVDSVQKVEVVLHAMIELYYCTYTVGWYGTYRQ